MGRQERDGGMRLQTGEGEGRMGTGVMVRGRRGRVEVEGGDKTVWITRHSQI